MVNKAKEKETHFKIFVVKYVNLSIPWTTFVQEQTIIPLLAYSTSFFCLKSHHVDPGEDYGWQKKFTSWRIKQAH